MTPHQLLQSLINSGMTQSQIAIGTGINQPTISRILSGKQVEIRSAAYGKLIKFYDALRVSKKAA